MPSKLRTEHPEEMRQVMSRRGQKQPPQRPPQAQEVLPVCQ
jgi:hypothetical protein